MDKTDAVLFKTYYQINFYKHGYDPKQHVFEKKNGMGKLSMETVQLLA